VWEERNLLVCSLPLHRHSYIGFILDFASSFHNKQPKTLCLSSAFALSIHNKHLWCCVTFRTLHNRKECDHNVVITKPRVSSVHESVTYKHEISWVWCRLNVCLTVTYQTRRSWLVWLHSVWNITIHTEIFEQWFLLVLFMCRGKQWIGKCDSP